ncbi:MAG: sugar nucleotide-binding protein [Halieaceae bacterium]|jgi:dTDP-4-dehydrorhamnose reductase|nr:sugar nucleotide-binding protein [Halieaceae bacterium]
MKVLLIGSDTPVGQALCNFFDLRGTEYTPLSKSECRWKSERQAKKALRRSEAGLAVDARIQAAADGGIRIHEADIERCMWLARASQALRIPMLLLSCASIFEGKESRAYREEDYPDGMSTLASLIGAAETAVRDHCERHVILRMGPVFSPVGSNSLTWMLNRLHEHGSLSLSRKLKGCPVAAEDAARVVSGMVDQYGCGLEAWGIFHYCSADVTSCYEFAEVLLAAAYQYTAFREDDPSILTPLEADDDDESSAEDWQSLEFRLDCSKIRDTFAIKQQPWRASVAGHAKQYYALYSAREKTDGESLGQRDASA